MKKLRRLLDLEIRHTWIWLLILLKLPTVVIFTCSLSYESVNYNQSYSFTAVFFTAKNLTSTEIAKINRCEDLLSGSEVASLKRICLQTRSGRNERNLIKLKELWCRDQEYKTSVLKCIDHKFQTRPSTVYSIYRPRGTITTGWKTIVSPSQTPSFQSISISHNLFFHLTTGLFQEGIGL
jgi:hypothetical protein